MVDQDKVEIKICLGSSCFSRGNRIILQDINKFIEESNSELRNLQNEKIQYINIQELLCSDEKNFTKDTVHFTKIGHERLANYLKNNIKELNNAI